MIKLTELDCYRALYGELWKYVPHYCDKITAEFAELIRAIG